ncbi:MAG: RES domain-containing protein [Rhodospirillales bacterium]|nr:RES domain-containing protein [Rhodospirillales bacterium]
MARLPRSSPPSRGVEGLATEPNGIVYPSVRRAGGTCLVAFHPASVQNVRQGGIWRLEWRGTREPTMRRVRAHGVRAARAG